MWAAMRMAEYPKSEPTSIPRVGLWRARSRLITRPFSFPMTGMCHSVTARSIRRSIFCARLVTGRRGAPSRRREGDSAGSRARLDDLPGEHASHDLLHALRHADERVQVD